MKNKKIFHAFISFANYFPKDVINFGVQCVGLFWDKIDQLHDQSFTLLPPLAIRIKVNTPYALSYKKYGADFLKYFIDICGLKKNGRVLDIGCGSGILATPLTKYLNKEGRYNGLDINEKLINWCKLNISSRYSNFHFKLVNVYNGKYNPEGKKSPTKLKFPYENNSFDLVVLSSVFTHMLPKDVEHYLKEIARVLKKNGKCLITYKLINPEIENLIKNKKSKFDFKYSFGNYRTATIPKNNLSFEDVVGYNETYIRNLYKKNRLRIKLPIYYGSWSGKKKSLKSQDIIVAVKV